MPKWAHGEHLQQTLKIVVFGDKAPNDKVRFVKLHTKFGEVSSTRARANKGSPDDLSPSVAKYVADNKLFEHN